MNTFKQMTASLRREVTSPRFRPAYEQGRESSPWLALFPTVSATLEALNDERPETYPIREALTKALIAEHRKGRSPLWSTMLLVAYLPMLARVRVCIVGNIVPDDDVDQVVLEGFLDAIGGVPIGPTSDRMAMRLKQRTRRFVFGYLRLERGRPVTTPGLDELLPEEAALVEPPPDSEGSALARYDLMKLAGSEISLDTLDLALRTLERPDALREQAARLVLEDDAERERAYQRLKKQRTRALQRLRLSARDELMVQRRIAAGSPVTPRVQAAG